MENKSQTAPAPEKLALSPAPVVMNRGLPSIWATDESLTIAIKMAEYLSGANIIPQQYQRNPGDCLIAIDLARQMGLSPVVIMQNTQVVRGNLTWKGSACKALVDGCGRFRNSRYEFCGKPGEWGWGCRLCAESTRSNATIQGPWVTMRMAKDEGWLDKNGSKWRTMPELMMRYRAASFFAKTECPEAMMGFSSEEEMRDITGDYGEPAAPQALDGVEFSYGDETDAASKPEADTPTCDDVPPDDSAPDAPEAPVQKVQDGQMGLDDL